MHLHHRHLAAAGAALFAAAVLAACGSGGTSGTATPSPSGPPAASSAATAPGAFNATDVAFTRGMLRLEGQSAAMAALAAGRTTTPQLTRLASHLRDHGTDAQHMRGWMRQWHQNAPAPYTPGATPPAGTGPGMMGAGDWEDMARERGHAFDSDWAGQMIRHHAAEITLCRTELRAGINPQARALAQRMLTERQTELTQLRNWHDSWANGDDHDR